MAENTIPKRADIPSDCRWKLTDIFATNDDWQATRDSIEAELEKITAFKGRLADPQQVLDCFKTANDLGILVSNVFAYARMTADTDTADQTSQAMVSSCLPLLDKFNAACAFIDPELLALPEATLANMADALPELETYRFRLQELLRSKEHILSPEQEEFLARTGEMRNTARDTYTVMTNADLKFPDTLGEDGKFTTLSESRYTQFLRSTNQAVRADAFKKLFTTYHKFRNTLASLYSSSVKASRFIAEMRHYPSMIAAGLDSDNIPLAVYDNTIASTHKYLPELHRYMRLKKRLLKLDELHMYDLYVPVVKKPTTKFTFEKSREILKSALAPLGEQYLQDLFNGLDGGWVDRLENEGKRSGAYSWGVYGVHPFILMSWHDDYHSLSTLAHELGHSLHSFYSNQKQAYTNSQYTIFCAEVASTTNENLLLEYMLAHSEGQERFYYLNLYLEQIRTTVFRQVLFAEFEKLTHAAVENNEALTADKLESIWLDLNKKYYGDDVILDDELKSEWSRIPHFYRPFYVYQYATGYAAAITLSSKICHEGTPAQTAYLKYLASGGSDYSITLLKNAGVDMTSPTPFSTTFEKFRQCLDELGKI